MNQEWIPYEPELVNAREWNPELDERFRIQELFATMPVELTPENQGTTETIVDLEDLMNFTEETSSTPGILSPRPQSYAAVPALTALETQAATLASEPRPVPAITDKGLVRSQPSLINIDAVPATTAPGPALVTEKVKQTPRKKTIPQEGTPPRFQKRNVAFRLETPGKVTKTPRRRRIPVLDKTPGPARVEDNRAKEGAIVMNDNMVAVIASQLQDNEACTGEWSIPGDPRRIHYLMYLIGPNDSLTQ
jgi:hypothetical protein